MRPVQDVEVYLCREPVDFRKAINGLSILVEESLGLDPFAARLYVFRNRKGDRVKVLYWERNGFVLWQKRLERDRFPWPEGEREAVVTMTGRELNWLLDGIDLFRLKPHAALSYASVL
jgi:transposase